MAVSSGGTHATSPRRLKKLQTCRLSRARAKVQRVQRCSGAKAQRRTLVRSQLLPAKGRLPKAVQPGATRSGMHALHAAPTAASNE